METRHIQCHMGKQDLPALTQRLEAHKPASLLAMGPRAGDVLTAYRKAHGECRITHLDGDGTLGAAALMEALAEHPRYDFVIVRGELERLDTETGAHLLARLRDVHSRRFCVLLDSNDDEPRWRASELVAMGLTHWAGESTQATGLEMYGFDLATYKATPKWLNARHWAHPEQWGKNRW
jgi:hypothetical protein